MAAEATSSSAVPLSEGNSLSANISIVSPSVAVNAPLNFPGLPASTTVAQLKERIRDALDTKPSNEQQRLIHQGKLLSRENDSLLDIFGEQKPRASMGLHGVPEQAGNQQFPANPGQERNSPRPEYQGHVRETYGPNGEVIRVMTNSAFIAPNGQVFPLNLQQGHAGVPTPGGPFSTNDVQNIMRNADASQATSIMTDAMQRSASGASLANLNLSNQRQPIQPPGVTVSRRPSSTVPTVPLSRTATPDAMRTSSFGSASAPPQAAMRSSTSNQPEVYILNSPQGPRALLINNHSDLYYTPAARYPMAPLVPSFNPLWIQPHPHPHPQSQPQPRSGPSTDYAQQAGQPQPAAAAQQQAPQQGNIRVNLFQGPPAQQQERQHPQAQVRPLARGHVANPEAGVAGALVAALWPHVWLMIRLAVFVWWFTSSDTSWTRWFTIMSVATAVFLINTGLLNGIVHHMLNPVRQHLEGLIPLGGPDPNRDRDGNGNNAQAAAQDGENNQTPRPQQQRGQPDPARVAARLVAQRQEQNANWLLDQVRRLERAGLLFLASIAPGVAERHIAALEAQERAERERREAEERAERERREAAEREAVEATATAVDAAVASVEGEHGGSSGSGAGGNGQQEQQAQQQQQPVAAS
ncbi:hypothetical protein VSDG_06561 [Cytospora chrysosperma]|uniref:Uncharacterized protein n=1 Tax=Cytospora chrysosperma TaxID=252740 RepID=A0A423VNP9_CYTCH|nr:hypothetical protein VSDG_06561 [Valsa sordida]